MSQHLEKIDTKQITESDILAKFKKGIIRIEELGFKVVYKRFIVIALNQNLNAATGCSIDASVHFIQQG